MILPLEQKRISLEYILVHSKFRHEKQNLENFKGVAVQVDQNKIKEIESDPNVAQVIDDATIESDETFDLILSGATTTSILDGTGAGTILNDTPLYQYLQSFTVARPLSIYFCY